MDAEKKEDMDRKWKTIATHAVTQEDFKQKLLKDPLQVMKEFGLQLSENIRPNIDKSKSITLLLPENSSEELKAEVTWWQWRLNTIREFGKDFQMGVQIVAPETEEGI